MLYYFNYKYIFQYECIIVFKMRKKKYKKHGRVQEVRCSNMVIHFLSLIFFFSLIEMF